MVNLFDRKWLEKITEKWHIKVLSVAAALILMIFYRTSALETRFFSAPLLIQGNDRLVPSNTYAQYVRVSLRGEANNINPILEEDINVYIDLTRYTAEGTYRVPVQIRRTGSAYGVEALEISVDPIEISIRLEEKITRHIPVVPVFSGIIAEGYELTGQSIAPTGVVAEGPRSSLESIYEFHTGTINLEGRYNDFSVIVNILNSEPFITIHGTRMAEYRGVISRRDLGGTGGILDSILEETENYEDTENMESADDDSPLDENEI